MLVHSSVLAKAAITGYSRVALCLFLKTGLRAKVYKWKWAPTASLSCKPNSFSSQRFCARLVLKQRHKITLKWFISVNHFYFTFQLASKLQISLFWFAIYRCPAKSQCRNFDLCIINNRKETKIVIWLCENSAVIARQSITRIDH